MSTLDEQVMAAFKMGSQVTFRNGLGVVSTGTCQGWSRDMVAPYRQYMIVQIGTHEHLKRISFDRILIGHTTKGGTIENSRTGTSGGRRNIA